MWASQLIKGKKGTCSNEGRLAKVSQLAELGEIGSSKGSKLEALRLGLATATLTGGLP